MDPKRHQTVHVYTDGGARGNPGPAGAGIVIKDGSGIIVKKKRFLGNTTNNVAEYRALILGLQEAKRIGPNVVFVYSDSELVVKQIKGKYRVKDKKLKPLFMKAKGLLDSFVQYSITHIKREQNTEADLLVNEAIDRHCN